MVYVEDISENMDSGEWYSVIDGGQMYRIKVENGVYLFYTQNGEPLLQDEDESEEEFDGLKQKLSSALIRKSL